MFRFDIGVNMDDEIDDDNEDDGDGDDGPDSDEDIDISHEDCKISSDSVIQSNILTSNKDVSNMSPSKNMNTNNTKEKDMDHIHKKSDLLNDKKPSDYREEDPDVLESHIRELRNQARMLEGLGALYV